VVGLGLDRVGGCWPVPLRGDDRLVVPVRPFDQADGDRQALAAGPRDQLVKVLVRLAKVHLHGQSQVRVLAELGIATEAAEDLEGDVLQPPHLHVDGQVKELRDIAAIERHRQVRKAVTVKVRRRDPQRSRSYRQRIQAPVREPRASLDVQHTDVVRVRPR